MARVSISEAARLTGKSRTTLHRLIKTGELSTCNGERNAKMVDTSELLRVFGPFEQPKGEHHSGQVSEQRDTAPADQSGVVSENGIYGHSRFCNTDFDDKLACLNLSGV